MKIRTFETSLTNEAPPKVTNTHIKEYAPPTPRKTKGRKYKGTNRDIFRHYLSEVFERNEYLAYDKKAITNKELLRELLTKYNYNYNFKKKLLSHKFTIGMFRKQYNQQTLYSAQPVPYLISIEYNEWGIPVVGGNFKYSYLSFEEAYQRCLEFKIADPRFVPPELIARVRDRINSQDPEWEEWIAPDDKWISKFETTIQAEAYNSVKFPIGWTREDTPLDD